MRGGWGETRGSERELKEVRRRERKGERRKGVLDRE
jgi:hypothetical protein